MDDVVSGETIRKDVTKVTEDYVFQHDRETAMVSYESIDVVDISTTTMVQKMESHVEENLIEFQEQSSGEFHSGYLMSLKDPFIDGCVLVAILITIGVNQKLQRHSQLSFCLFVTTEASKMCRSLLFLKHKVMQ